MIPRLLRRIALQAAVYDAIQRAAGSEIICEKLRQSIAPVGKPCMTVADIGGGTGIYRRAWPDNTRYVNIDPDPAKLGGFRARLPDDAAIRADGTRLPLADQSCDAIMVCFVLHHLDDAAARRFVHECARVLKPEGSLLIIDPLWQRDRLRSRILWALDRGSYPRTANQLESMINESFVPIATEQFAIHHRYWLCSGKKS